MEKTRIEVYKRMGDFWSCRYSNRAGIVTPSDVWKTRDEALEVAMAIAEERFREHGESVEVYLEDMGRLVPHNHGFLAL